MITLSYGYTFLSSMGFTVGAFYKVEKFFDQLAGKASFLVPVLGHSQFSLKRTLLLPVGAANDTIVSKCIARRLREDGSFRGFCRTTEEEFLNNLFERCKSFDSNTKRDFRIRAIQLQLKQSPFKVKRKVFSKACQLVRRDLLAKQANLVPLNSEQAAQRLKLAAGAGFWWFTKKSGVIMQIFNSANYLLSLSTDELSSILSFPAYVAYRVQQRASGVKLRLIYVYPAIITLFEQVFLAPVLDYFIAKNTLQPYCVSNTGYQLRDRWLCWQQRERVVSIDWSSYDQLANTYLIKEAFSIVREMFGKNMTKPYSFLFDLVVFYFLFTPIFTTNPQLKVEGIQFKKRGIPSGSSFTNLIGTIVNLLAVYCYLVEQGYEINGKFIASLGDDIVIATNSQFDLEHFSKTMEEWFAMSVSIEKSEIFLRGEKVYFLGATFDYNGRYINAELALYQCSTTTSDLFIKCTTSEEHYNRVRDKVASVLFKYSNGFILYDAIMAEVSRKLNVYKTDLYYTEIMTRASAPGIPFQAGRRSISEMRINGWLIQ